ncbi:MAG: hypothetical protein MUE51_03860 [Thermoleophilia bacterium]|jgi:hypothetical protein|nr:hypothetical protein [Thermoleophilia bacterium]
MSPRTLLTAAAAAAGTLALAAGPALGAQVSPTGTAVPRGGDILVIGTGFAPPNEFCRQPRLTIGGRAARVTGRMSDSVGGWALRVRATQAPGSYVLVMSQACENGNTGAVRTTQARARLRVLG